MYVRRSPAAVAIRLVSLVASIVISAGTFAMAADAIHPGDKVSVTVFNHPDLSSDLTVSSDGNIRLPVAGNVAVEGLSEPAAAARVGAALSHYLYHPEADVRVISEGQSIFFTGSLVGVQPFTPGETLGTAIGSFRQTLNSQPASSTSGAATIDSIDLREVRIKRADHVLPAVNLEELSRAGGSGPRLEPGDIVLLSAKPVRVDVRGNLATPMTVYVYPGETLAQAVAEAGPYSPTTSLTSIGLERDGTESTVSSAGAEFTSPAHNGDIVTLQPAPHVSVLGMVEKGGDTILQTRPTLLNALYGAGGPNRYADLKHVHITHNGQTQTVDISQLTHGDLTQNPPVQDGDVIFVPEGHKIDLSVFTNVLTSLTSLAIFKGL